MTLEKKLYEDLANQLTIVNNNIDKIIEVLKATKRSDNIFFQRITKQIEKQYEKLRKITARWVNSAILDIYQKYLNDQLTKIKYKTLPLQKQLSYQSFINSDLKKSSVEKIISSTLQSYYKGYMNGENQLKTLANYTQIINISEKKIAGIVAEAFEKDGSAKASVKALRDKLLKLAEDKKYIQIINKNGKKINYDIKAYSELVTRTKFNETNTQSVIDTSNAIESDLIQVSSHNTKTAYDAQFEGKIFSLSGKDTQFPKAIDLPPYHPNCLHSITIVFKEALIASNTLQEYVDFSTGLTEKHPTRKSHIPVSKREVE